MPGRIRGLFFQRSCTYHAVLQQQQVLFGNDYKMTESGNRQKGQTRIESIERKMDQILCTLFVKGRVF